jgi:RNA polymerase-binding protein DksA
MKKPKKMNKRELVAYTNRLLRRRHQLLGDVNSMESEALTNPRQLASGDLSNMPIHMADIGSDNYEQEFTLNLIQSERDELKAIDEALERIQSGTYGACENCEGEIPKSRLKIMPHARLCIECKRKEELTGE